MYNVLQLDYSILKSPKLAIFIILKIYFCIVFFSFLINFIQVGQIDHPSGPVSARGPYV